MTKYLLLGILIVTLEEVWYSHSQLLPYLAFSDQQHNIFIQVYDSLDEVFPVEE